MYVDISMEWNIMQDLKIYVLKECMLQNSVYSKIPMS